MEKIELLPDVYAVPENCLYLPQEKAIIAADFHIGYESALEQDGIHIPRFQTQTVQDALLHLLDKYTPEKLIILGDLKHDFSKNAEQERQDISAILRFLTKNTEVILVKGNHDNYLENIAARFGLNVYEQYELAGITLAHGHKNILSRPLIIGHEHPSIRITDRVGAALKLPCFLYLRAEQIIVLPAFSPLSAGTDVTRASAKSYLSPILKAVDVTQAELIACSDIGLLPLGKLSALDELLR
ncbi:metallophosphoesterase [Candidatus Methanomassiliicoccus intestinalis]|uniref:metallophosphoesterase n=1 Tax=Candidatus Methanomassiliicoccus intestinalis TaxID=1406512 RepID=UPI0037DD2DB1